MQGGDHGGDTILKLGGSEANHGAILLQSANNTYKSDISTGSSTLTNDYAGTIQINPGSGGERLIQGNLVNLGTLNCLANTTLGATGASLANAGLISIAGVTVTAVGSTLTNQVGGLISGYGTFNTSGISFTNSGILDLTQPSILGVDLEPTTLAITYHDTGTMNTATVTNAANYTILASGGDGLFGNGNDVDESGLISQITYTSSTQTALLKLSGTLPNDFYRVKVNGDAVKDTAGTSLLPGKLDQVNRVLGLVGAAAVLSLDSASDSGESSSDQITKVTKPTYDVQVNQAGTIAIDFQGDGTIDATLAVQIAGTYQFTPTAALADGVYPAKAVFTPASGTPVSVTDSVTIDTTPPRVLPPGGGAGTALHFDGVNDSVPVGNLGARPTQGTISFWMMADVVQNYRNVLTTGPVNQGGSGGNDAIRFEEDNGGLGAVIGNDGSDSFNGFTGHTLTGSLHAGTWYNVTVTWDSAANRVKGYLNGVLVFDDSNTTWPSHFTNLTFGVGWSTRPVLPGHDRRRPIVVRTALRRTSRHRHEHAPEWNRDRPDGLLAFR